MKRFITKIVSFSLAVAILSTTSSFSMDMHFCCNRLVDVAVFNDAKTCSEITQKTPIKRCISEDKSCCSNKSFVKIGDDIQTVFFYFNYDSFVFLSTFFYTYINLFEGLEKQVIPFETYVPPLVSKDIIVLHETFLI